MRRVQILRCGYVAINIACFCLLYCFQQVSPPSVDKDCGNPGNSDPNIPDQPEDRIKENGDCDPTATNVKY